MLITARIEDIVSGTMADGLEDSCWRVTQAMNEIASFLQKHPHLIQQAARDIATSVAHIYIGKNCLCHYKLLIQL